MVADQDGTLLGGADQTTGGGPPRNLASRIGRPVSVAIGPGVDRVMKQVLERLPVRPTPFEMVALPASMDAHRHANLMMNKITEQSVKRPLTLELIEDQPDGRLDLLVGIELESSRWASDVANRRQAVEFAASRLVPLALIHPFFEDM